MAAFVLVRPAPASCLWILLTECEHVETNTWQFVVLVKRAPASCLGFYSRNVNTLRPTLGSFCFGQASACILLWILFTECECFETNTWQLFKSSRLQEFKTSRAQENRLGIGSNVLEFTVCRSVWHEVFCCAGCPWWQWTKQRRCRSS